MKKKIFASIACSRSEQKCSGELETYPITIKKCAYFFDSADPSVAPCFWITAGGRRKYLKEIKSLEDLEKYNINYEFCGDSIVISNYFIQKNDFFTRLSYSRNATEKSAEDYTATNGKVRFFLTSSKKLVAKVEQHNCSYFIDFENVL